MVHWGPTMTLTPALHVRAGCGGALVGGRATLVAGHSAYVPHGIHGRVLLDLGNLVDNSPVDPLLRNDLSLHWLVTLEASGPRRIEGVPVKLEYAHSASPTMTSPRGVAAHGAAVRTSRLAGRETVGGRLVFEL
jgi:hypothetical protein